MNWLDRYTWPRKAISDMQGDIAAVRLAVLQLPTRLTRMEERMSAREDAAYERLNTTITTIKDGWASLTAERDQYKAALESADADKAAAVAAALEADSDVDAGKVEAADAALAKLVPTEPGSADEPAPADESGPAGEPQVVTNPDGSVDVTNPTPDPDAPNPSA